MSLYIVLVSEMMAPLIGSMAYLVTAQVKILKYNLRNLAKFSKKNCSDSGMVTFESVSEILKECISYHNDILL